jgi:SnoaL-like polyketide cyclase
MVEAFNAHDKAAIRALSAADVKFEAPGGVRAQGRDDVATLYVATLLDAFPDARITVSCETCCRSWVTQEFTLEGTHARPLQGPDGTIGTTGRRIVGHGVQITRFVNGLASEIKLYYDRAEVLMQLGDKGAMNGGEVLGLSRERGR